MSKHLNIPSELAASFEDVSPSEKRLLEEAWAISGDTPEVDRERMAGVWRAIDATTRPEARSQERRSILRLVPRLTPVFSRSFALAASIALFIAVGYFLSPSNSVYVGAPIADGLSTVSLSDGSSVSLSAGSRLSVSDSFDGDGARTVRLSGEAFFDVAHDEARPFVVQTFNASVEVLGTAFNVRSWPDAQAGDTEVFVSRGSVRVASSAVSGMDVTLDPGEASIVSGSAPTAPAVLESTRVLAWLDGGLAFDDEPMGDVLDEIARRYDVRIQADASVRSVRVSYWKRSEVGVDEMIDDLADTADLRFRRTTRGFELFRP